MLRLLHFPLCPYSRKVRLALAEKELEVEAAPVEPWEHRDTLAELNPAAEVPILQNSAAVIADSSAICEWLEETYPEPGLLGESPAERAEVRRLVAWFDVKFAREVTDLVWAQKLLKRVRDRETPNSMAVRTGVYNIRAHLEYIGFLFEHRNWLAGERLSLADIAAAAHLSVHDYLGDIPWDEYPEAKLWYARFKSRPSFRPLLQDRLTGFRPVAHYDNLDF